MARVDHEPLKIRVANQHVEERFPDALVSPTAEPAVDIFPIAVIRRQIAPRCASTQNPKDGIDECAVISGIAAPTFPDAPEVTALKVSKRNLKYHDDEAQNHSFSCRKSNKI